MSEQRDVRGPYLVAGTELWYVRVGGRLLPGHVERIAVLDQFAIRLHPAAPPRQHRYYATLAEAAAALAALQRHGD